MSQNIYVIFIVGQTIHQGPSVSWSALVAEGGINNTDSEWDTFVQSILCPLSSMKTSTTHQSLFIPMDITFGILNHKLHAVQVVTVFRADITFGISSKVGEYKTKASKLCDLMDIMKSLNIQVTFGKAQCPSFYPFGAGLIVKKNNAHFHPSFLAHDLLKCNAHASIFLLQGLLK